MQKTMRSGITTGTCAAAAAKAAILAWRGETPDTVNVTTPQGVDLKVKIASYEANESNSRASVIKDAGDDPDITHGIEIVACVAINHSGELHIVAGRGVGTVTKPGLSVPQGQPAINPGPQKMIQQALMDCLPPGYGATVTISIPNGETLAKRTLNPFLGVVGGLSIIGTTGIVEPMSEEAFKNSLTPQISVVKALGYDDIVFVPGKIGQDIAINNCNLPAQLVVQTSNFIGHMLENAVRYKIKRVLLFGHLGKLVKVAAGIFHTHNRMADARLETLAAHMALNGAPTNAIHEIMDCTTTESAIPIINSYKMTQIYNQLAAKASSRAERYVFNDLQVGTVIVTLKGDILGMDANARKIGGGLAWNIDLS